MNSIIVYVDGGSLGNSLIAKAMGAPRCGTKKRCAAS